MATEPQMLSNNYYKYECNSDIQKASNNRIYDRNLPSANLQPYLSVRPVLTKYSIMPIVDPRAPIKTPLQQMPVYNPEKVFNPGNTQSPWSGYAAAVNTESELRNQIYALQACSQAVYVPSSKSDLYQCTFQPANSGNMPQQFQGLFQQEHFNSFNPNTENVGTGLFNNYTRQQIRDLTGKPKPKMKTNEKC
jgi:hypothetical protein